MTWTGSHGFVDCALEAVGLGSPSKHIPQGSQGSQSWILKKHGFYCAGIRKSLSTSKGIISHRDKKGAKPSFRELLMTIAIDCVSRRCLDWCGRLCGRRWVISDESEYVQVIEERLLSLTYSTDPLHAWERSRQSFSINMHCLDTYKIQSQYGSVTDIPGTRIIHQRPYL